MAKSASLVKLKLIAYSDTSYSSEEGTFVASINPESYTHNHGVKFSETKSVAEGEGNAPKFNSVDTETVDFSIYLDGTGVAGNKKTVGAQISELKKVIYQYNGKNHRTNYIKILWGSLVFYCNLTKLSINYTMFSPNGKPLRAKADVSFSGFTNAKLMAAKANKQSPDMSHLKVMKPTNNIQLFCSEIYKEGSLYIEVARANDLDTFRKVRDGKVLLFPQLNK
jgi:hypothetical protein